MARRGFERIELTIFWLERWRLGDVVNPNGKDNANQDTFLMKPLKSRPVAKGGGGLWGLKPPQFLADQLTLSKPGGAHSPHPVLRAPPDFQTLRRPCIINTQKPSYSTIIYPVKMEYG